MFLSVKLGHLKKLSEAFNMWPVVLGLYIRNIWSRKLYVKTLDCCIDNINLTYFKALNALLNFNSVLKEISSL